MAPKATSLGGERAHQFIRRKSINSVIDTDLATNVFTDGGGSIQLQQHVGLQQVLGPVHLKVGHGGGQPHPLMLDVEHHGFLVQLVCDEVDAPQSGVLVAGVEALEAVGDAELSAVLREGVRVVGAAAHGPVPVSDQSVCHLDNRMWDLIHQPTPNTVY